jgi:hypothetical protein
MVKRSKRTVKSYASCSSIGCIYYAAKGKKKCSCCAKGLKPVDPLEFLINSKSYKCKIMAEVHKHTISDKDFDGIARPTLIGFLSALNKFEQQRSGHMPILPKVMLRADQVLKLGLNWDNYQNSAYNLPNQAHATISLHDQVLGRVLDYWNLGGPLFPPVVRCYWGKFGDYLNPIKLYNDRKKVVLDMTKSLYFCARDRDVMPNQLLRLVLETTLFKFITI